MAHILAFQSRDRAETKPERGEAGRSSAEIVIFPGVRYERATTEPETTGKEARRRPRDHLDLPEA